MNKLIGVIGAGVMGTGVAQRFAHYGYNVLIIDKEQSILDTAITNIKRDLKAKCLFDKGIDINSIMGRIVCSTDYSALAKANYVVENVPEVPEIKKEVYSQLENVCNKECIYMVNTSCIPITSIAALTGRSDKVIGVHFMNPVPVKNFAEVIRGWHTSQAVIEEVTELLASVKIAVEVVNDSAGFVSNRVSHLFMNEAAYLVYEGIATAEQVDNIFRNAFAHKMGPLETADLIGIDTVLHSLNILYNEYEDSKFRACPLLKQMVRAGHLGRKSGEGFHKYK